MSANKFPSPRFRTAAEQAINAPEVQSYMRDTFHGTLEAEFYAIGDALNFKAAGSGRMLMAQFGPVDVEQYTDEQLVSDMIKACMIAMQPPNLPKS